MAVTLAGITGIVEAGTYTPTSSAEVNITASTPRLCKYIKIGKVVVVTGQIDIDPIAAVPTTTSFELNLPIPSDIGSSYDLSGTMSGTSYTQCGGILGSIPNNTAMFSYQAVNAGPDNILFTFTYQIV